MRPELGALHVFVDLFHAPPYATQFMQVLAVKLNCPRVGLAKKRVESVATRTMDLPKIIALLNIYECCNYKFNLLVLFYIASYLNIHC